MPEFFLLWYSVYASKSLEQKENQAIAHIVAQSFPSCSNLLIDMISTVSNRAVLSPGENHAP